MLQHTLWTLWKNSFYYISEGFNISLICLVIHFLHFLQLQISQKEYQMAENFVTYHNKGNGRV